MRIFNMRIAILLIVCAIGVCPKLNAQSLSDLKMTLPSLEERYDMDYHIEGIWRVTADTLVGLDLAQYEEFRAIDEDVFIFDPTTGFHIQLFSVNKAIENYTYRFKQDADDLD